MMYADYVKGIEPVSWREKPGCVGCGTCCNFKSGFPQLFPEDLLRWKNLPRILNELAFGIINHEGVNTQIWTFRHDGKYNCPFRHEGKCSIYKVRPLTCRVYPETGMCHHGQRHAQAPKAERKAFLKAHARWQTYPLVEYIQEHLRQVIAYARSVIK